MNEAGLAPCLLLAMPQLMDPNFERAVVLMVEHTAEGSFGLIVNRQSQIPVSELMLTLDIEWLGDPAAVVWYGGPVMPATGWLLHAPIQAEEDEDDGEDAILVAPGLMLSTSPKQLTSVAARPPVRVRFLMGYAGWGAAQLESELAAGSWLTTQATPELVFDTPPERMWEAATRSLGIDPATLVPASGIH